MKYYIGIDLGGTNIVAGVVDENYNIISKASTKTNLPRPEKEIADDMAKVSVQAVKEAGISMEQIEWVGIGTPGIANSEKGIIEYSCNLGFNNTPMVEYIKNLLTSRCLLKMTPMRRLTANMLPVRQKALKTQCALLSAQALAAVLLLTVKFTPVQILQALKSVIL